MPQPRLAAIYARFSTDRQSERSVDDQIALCRAYAAREGLTVGPIFEDRAISGASMANRPGIQAMMAAVRQGGFDSIIVEDLERLSRDMEDLAHIYKRIKHQDIEIRALNDGLVNTVLVGLRGLTGQMYREDGALRIRGRMKELVRSGMSAGGAAYGYQAIPGEVGQLRVVEAEAETVRRIYTDYLAGIRPRAIAAHLNDDRVPAPRGLRWNASTINGSKSRGNGILANALYDGRIVWNKIRMVKDPDTGKRISRPNAASAHQVAEAPHLRIVPAEIFARVQELHALRGSVRAGLTRQPKHLLSGLLRCGCCGGGMSIKDGARAAGRRIQCTVMKESGACDHRTPHYVDDVEGRVLHALKAHLHDPRAIERFAMTYIEERRRLAAATAGDRERLERRLGEISREIARGTDALLKGRVPEDIIGPALAALAGERDAINRQLAQVAPLPSTVALHPTAVRRYAAAVHDLARSLTAVVRDGDGDAAQALRDLVESVVITPGDDGPAVVIKGRLAALTGTNVFPDGPAPGGASAVPRFGGDRLQRAPATIPPP